MRSISPLVFDLYLCNYAYPEILTLGKVIVLEKNDSASVTSSNMKYINHPNLIAILKEYIYSDLRNYNFRFLLNRYHYSLTEGELDNKYSLADVKIKPEYHKIQQSSWNLYQYSFVGHKKMERLKAVPHTVKDIDILCISHPHAEHDPLYNHRLKYKNIVLNSPELSEYTIKHESVSGREYMDILSRSKICIAPYGLGSRIALDQYGLIARCIVIKPEMDHVVVEPNIYTPDFMEFVDSNWNNLVEKILDILENYKKYSVIATTRRIQVLKFDEKYYVDTFIKKIHTIIEDN